MKAPRGYTAALEPEALARVVFLAEMVELGTPIAEARTVWASMSAEKRAERVAQLARK
jgi:hypothetical protein